MQAATIIPTAGEDLRRIEAQIQSLSKWGERLSTLDSAIGYVGVEGEKLFGNDRERSSLQQFRLREDAIMIEQQNKLTSRLAKLVQEVRVITTENQRLGRENQQLRLDAAAAIAERDLSRRNITDLTERNKLLSEERDALQGGLPWLLFSPTTRDGAVNPVFA